MANMLLLGNWTENAPSVRVSRQQNFGGTYRLSIRVRPVGTDVVIVQSSRRKRSTHAVNRGCQLCFEMVIHFEEVTSNWQRSLRRRLYKVFV